MDAEFFYVVVKGTDGQLVTYTEMPEEELKPSRQATTADIFATSRTIVEEVDKQDLVGRILQALAAAVPQPEPTVSDKVKDKLKERGINPESVAPAE